MRRSRTIVGLSLAVAVCLLGSLAHAGSRITLQSTLSGKYIRAGVGQQTLLAACSPRVYRNGWEEFVWVNQGTRFMLQSVVNGKYVSVGRDGLLRANRTLPSRPTPDMLFVYVRLNNGEFAIRSELNQKYIRAGVGQYSMLGAMSQRVGGWERFRLEIKD